MRTRRRSHEGVEFKCLFSVLFGPRCDCNVSFWHRERKEVRAEAAEAGTETGGLGIEGRWKGGRACVRASVGRWTW